MWGRALLVRHGGGVGVKGSLLQPAASVASLPLQPAGEGEVIVQVQATALTPTDVLLCSELRPPLNDLVALPAAPFVPGHYFCGEVIQVGPFVQGISIGETVLGVLDSPTVLRAPPTDVSLTTTGAIDGEEGSAGGCYREKACVQYSSLLPTASLLAAGCHMPALVAHLPPMVEALFCVANHLRLRQEEALLIIAPRLKDVIFLLQRLVLISQNWIGPLYLILLHGSPPTHSDLEKHSLLRPLLLPSPAKVADMSADGEKPMSFLENFQGFSVEQHVQQRFGASPSVAQLTSGLQEIVGQVLDTTGGLGVDVVLALDVDLAPPRAPAPEEAFAESVSGSNGPSNAEASRPPTLLRTLIGALNLRGRLVTNCGHVEMMPADGEHLWIKEASMSFLNPHSLLLSAARKGTLLHAVVEVLQRIAAAELPIAESEVVQYRLFEQFNHALERSRAGGADLRLITLLP